MNLLVWLLLALFPLVLVHELGHFLVAKARGVHVEEFGIGFPPRLVRLFHLGGTDYTINALPLGGFVRMLGEDDPDVPGAFASKGKGTRAAVLFAGPFANYLFAIVILAGVALAGVLTPLPDVHGVRIGNVLEGEPAAAAGLVPDDVVVAVNGTPLVESAAASGQNEVTTLQDLTSAATGTEMALTVVSGLEAVEADLAASGIETVAFDEPWLDGERVLVAPATSGLLPGDVIVDSEDGRHALRLGDTREVVVVPAAVEVDGAEVGRIGVGIGPAGATVTHPPVAAAVWGFTTTNDMLVRMLTALAGMFTGDTPTDLAGPVRIGEMSSQAAQGGATTFLAFMALLSLNLGLINLLPIPALDGGRLVFVGLEAVRGRRIEPSREQLVHIIGFVVVIGLMMVLTVVEVAGLLGVSLR